MNSNSNLLLDFLVISPSLNWHEVNSSLVSSAELVNIMTDYASLGLPLYVGTDSMLYADCCIFSCIIAVHSNELNIANYYFQKEKLKQDKFKNLENKILKEVELSIKTANFFREHIPEADIEIHVDIGDKERNATRHLVDSTKGWVKGMGYQFRIKPNSWASSVADWHTK